MRKTIVIDVPTRLFDPKVLGDINSPLAALDDKTRMATEVSFGARVAVQTDPQYEAAVRDAYKKAGFQVRDSISN